SHSWGSGDFWSFQFIRSPFVADFSPCGVSLVPHRTPRASSSSSGRLGLHCCGGGASALAVAGLQSCMSLSHASRFHVLYWCAGEALRDGCFAHCRFSRLHVVSSYFCVVRLLCVICNSCVVDSVGHSAVCSHFALLTCIPVPVLVLNL